MKRRTLVAWSSGKDSAWMLHLLRESPDYEPVGLLTTVSEETGAVAMHGTAPELLAAQSRAAGLPLWEAPIPWPCPNASYEAAMARVCERARRERVECIAFGDLFLEDIRRYREDKMRGTGLDLVFPLWGRDTSALIREMLAGGLRARVVAVDSAKLPETFNGRELDEAFLADLPAGTDPCGENGEFHTFAYAGPMFREAVL